jgi:hypothetical protein
MGSLAMRTSYQDPNVNIETGGVGAGAALGGLDPFFMNMVKKRMAMQAMRDRFSLAQMQEALPKATGPTGRPDQEGDLQRYKDIGYQRNLMQADLNPPKKLVSGFNMIPGYVSDTESLPLSLRPKGASFQGLPGPSGAGIDPRMSGTGGYDPVGAEEEARQRLGGPGGTGYGSEIGARNYVGDKALSDQDWLEKRQGQRRMLYGGSLGGR